MKMLPLPLALLLLTACTDSHTADDAGLLDDAAVLPPDAALDAGPRDTGTFDSGCRLTEEALFSAQVGEGCFCDGPFVVQGELAYRLSFALEVIDLNEPSAPVLVISVPQRASFSSDIAIVGDVLFTAGGALERFDLADPRAPVSIDLIELDGSATAMAVDGASMAVAIRRDDGSHAILAIDASDPRALVIGAPIELGNGEVGTLLVRGDVAFAAVTDVSGEASLLAIDLLEGVTLDSIARGTGSLTAMVAHAGHLFVSDLSDGVTLIDATDPSALVDLGVIPLETEYVFSLGLSGDRLVVMGDGAWLYDASNPRALRPLGHAALASDRGHAGLLVDGDRETLVLSGGNGLTTVPLVCE
jgi:hypothetical protein